MRFPISLPLQLCLYLAPFARYYHYFPKLRLRYPEHIPFGGSLSCMHWYMVLLYEAHSFTNEIYDWGKIEEKTAHVTLTTPIRG